MYTPLPITSVPGLSGREEQLALQSMKFDWDRDVNPEYCPHCEGLLTQEWDNLGFQAPDPEHWEVVDEHCDSCGWSDDHAESEVL